MLAPSGRGYERGGNGHPCFCTREMKGWWAGQGRGFALPPLAAACPCPLAVGSNVSPEFIDRKVRVEKEM